MPRQLGCDPAVLGATGGEDYELCAFVDPADRDRCEPAVPRLSWVGKVTPGPPAGARQDGAAGPLALDGFEHRLGRQARAGGGRPGRP